MARFISLPEMGIIIDGIYRNYSKAKIDQKNVNKLAADCNTSVTVLLKVRNILIARQQLIVEGERATQKCFWNTAKSAPNPVMLTEVYRVYTKDAKSRVKVEIKKERRLPSFESALLAIRKAGWDEISLRKTEGYCRTTKDINLSAMEEGE